MERNGLLDRKREAKVGKWVLGVSLFFLVSFFLAPLTLERGTVGPMEGRANAVDFYDDEGFGSNGNQNQVPHKHEGEEQSHAHLVLVDGCESLCCIYLRFWRRELPSETRTIVASKRKPTSGMYP